MRKAKKLSNKLMAILLSASMVFAPVMQSMPVYAAEPVIEEGSADTPTDNATTDEPDTDNNDSDTPDTDNGDSENQGTENGDTENPGTENGDSDNSGTENGDADNSGTENGDSDNTGTEDGDSENSGTEDGDTENPEDPDAEDGNSEDLGDGEADESQDEVQGFAFESVGVSAVTLRGQRAVKVSGFSNVGGWNESIYAEIAGIEPTDVVDVEYSGPTTGKLSTQKGNVDGETALDYLVRKDGSGVRIDIPGLKKGTYTLTVTVGSDNTPIKQENIEVYAYDRSGYAHFNYTDGVGAYTDDGTLKDNAVVLYVTDENKETVTLTVGNTTVTGIGNILNSVGQDVGGGLASNGGKANSNQGIIKKLAEANKSLVVRFIGVVSDSGLYKPGEFNAGSTSKITGLTIYNTTGNGGTKGDNGHMARIKSGKNITLEGIGYDATIDGWGFHFMAETSTEGFGYGKSFEVRNLKFINTPEDAIGMEGVQVSANTSSELSASVERCWIHNNEFYCPNISNPAESDKGEGDGSVDFKRGQYLTCSYNYFERCHKTNLVGSSDSSLQFNLTYHHNHWYLCKARGPLSRNANIHMYNNFFEMQTDYAQNTRADAYIFSEYNLFYASKGPQRVDKGAIKSYHDSVASLDGSYNPTVVTSKDEYVSNACQFRAKGIKYDKFDVDSSLSYIKDNDYDLQTDFAELRKVLVSQTGVMDQNPKLSSEVKVNEYSVIPDNVTINSLVPGQTVKPGKITKTVYAFEVSGAFNLDVKYSGSVVGVLVNEAGENLLEGSGERINLPAGKYIIQGAKIQAGDSASGTKAIFKNITIDELKIEAYDSNAHYHAWTKGPLVEAESQAATCTVDGKNTYSYTCSGCTETKTETETVKALGHSWPSNWTVVKQPTSTEPGSEKRVCTRCGYEDTREIPIGSTGGGSTGGGTGVVTPEGDYVLTFPGKKVSNPSSFFNVNSGGGFSNSKGKVTVNGQEYGECLKFGSSKITFTCNEGATLFMVFNQSSKIKVNNDTKDIGSDGTLTLENLPAGTYEISKLSGNDAFLFYMSVTNPAPEVVTYTIAFEYNYDDAPDAKEIEVAEDTTYNTMSDLVPQSFERTDYILKALYTDADCTDEVEYPYVVKGNARLYAEWEEDNAADGYLLIFNTNGGSSVSSVRVSKSQVYTITQKPTRGGYAFAGWYDAAEGGKQVTSVDGSKLTENYTVYAHWKFNITFDAGDGTAPKGLKDTTADAEDVIEIGDCTPPKGYTFKGWSADGGVNTFKGKYTVKAADASDGSITIEAVYDTMKYTVKYDANGGTLPSSMEASVEASTGDTLTLGSCTTTEEGKKFFGWSIGESSEVFVGTYTVNAADADKDNIITIKAVYVSSEGDSGLPCTVTLDTDGGTRVNGGGNTILVESGKTIDPGKCEKPGYTFNGWTVDGNPITIPYKVESDVTLKASYTIGISHEGISIIGLEESYEYTGAKIIPNIGVVDYNIGDDGKILAPGVDYTVKYKNNKNVGDATITVTGKGNYAGKDVTKKFKIKAVEDLKDGLLNLQGAKIAKINSIEYTGKELHPAFTLTQKGKTPTEYTYNETKGVYETKAGEALAANVALSNNINKGTATILITGETPKGKNKATSVKKTFKITPIDLAKNASKVNVTATAGTYSVKGAAPGSITVTYDSKELRKGIDYTVKYTANKKATTSATARIVITGKGNYAKKFTGTGTTYAINKLDMSELEVKAVTACEGIKAGKVKATVLDKERNILKPSQYTLKIYTSIDGNDTYDASKPLAKGTMIYVVAEAKDTANLKENSATDRAAFTVAEKTKNIAKAKIKLGKDKTTKKTITKIYDGSEQELTKDDLDTTLVMGTDYVIAGYSNNVNKGTATAIIKGIGSYSGTKTIKFKIVGKSMVIDGDDDISWDDVTDVISSFMKKLVK